MEKTEIKKPTIQERIATRVNEICDPVEAWLDRFNNNPDRFNPDSIKNLKTYCNYVRKT